MNRIAVFLSAILAAVLPQIVAQSPMKYVQKRVPPSDLKMLPAPLRSKLQTMGCMVPQPPTSDPGVRNVIHGEFQRSGQTDWAVVCDFPSHTEAIVVFWQGSVSQNSFASRSPAHEGGCWSEITPVGREFIMRHYRAFGGPKPPPMDHQGIDSSICEKASTTLYFYRGRWLQLTGSD